MNTIFCATGAFSRLRLQPGLTEVADAKFLHKNQNFIITAGTGSIGPKDQKMGQNVRNFKGGSQWEYTQYRLLNSFTLTYLDDTVLNRGGSQ